MSQRYGPNTYSQHGEDIFLVNLFELIGVDKPSYLDIGAHHPDEISNTKLLYERGSRGFNIEVNPELYKLFQQHRPEDTNLNLGVAAKAGKLNFWMDHEMGGRNTFSELERDLLIAEGRHVWSKEIEVISIQDLMNDYVFQWPHLLSIDIEGLDYELLESADFTSGQGAPIVICVEVRKNKTMDFIIMMNRKDYRPIARLSENLIFLEQGRWLDYITGRRTI